MDREALQSSDRRPHIEAPSPGCPPDLLDIISTLKPPSRMATKNDGGGGLHVFCFDLHAIPPHKAKLELRFMTLVGDVPMGLVHLVEEKLIVIFSPMNMDVAGYDFPLVPRLNQSLFLIFSLRWNELNEQASLVLQGSSSHLTLFSAYGAVCMVLWVTLDAISQEAYDVVMI
ncbi:hypothetical protein YC2023_119249 [Brassica napus]